DRLAPTRLPPVVDLEEPLSHGASDGTHREPGADPHHGGSEPTLGRAADSWRTAEARDRRLSGNDCEIHGTPRSASIADVAHVLTESHRPDRGGRFLRGPDRDLPSLVRPGASRPRSATHPARRGHRASDGGVDGPTTSRSLSVGRGTSISGPRS